MRIAVLRPLCFLVLCLSPVPQVPAADPPLEARPFLGVLLGPPEQGGVRIDRVFPGTAAEAAGVRVGDVMIRLDDREIVDGNALLRAIGSQEVGAEMRLELLREGRPIVLRAVLGPRPDDLAMRRDEADRVLAVLRARPGQVVADIGCGTGWLSFALAEVVGEAGRVYAVEIDEDHVRRLRQRPTSNIVPVHSRPDDVSLPEDSLDIAMLHDVASHVAERGRESFYDSVRRALKPGGRLVIFEPHGGAAEMLRYLRGYGVIPLQADSLEGMSSEQLDEQLDHGIAFRMEPRSRPPS